jgi:hypothetical protein
MSMETVSSAYAVVINAEKQIVKIIDKYTILVAIFPLNLPSSIKISKQY